MRTQRAHSIVAMIVSWTRYSRIELGLQWQRHGMHSDYTAFYATQLCLYCGFLALILRFHGVLLFYITLVQRIYGAVVAIIALEKCLGITKTKVIERLKHSRWTTASWVTKSCLYTNKAAYANLMNVIIERRHRKRAPPRRRKDLTRHWLPPLDCHPRCLTSFYGVSTATAAQCNRRETAVASPWSQ